MTIVFLAIKSPFTSALTTSDFKPGRIIDDTVFYDKNSMSVQQIQDFLNRLIPACDTYGNQPISQGSTVTRAQYAAQVGWPAPPYACINNYHENPDTGETSFEKGGGSFPGGISAAQIIYNAAQAYDINPQVLLVLLKKESAGPLTSDPWPLKSQYRYAMGYACPDSGPGYSANCSNEKAGFYKQVMLAAWQMKYYKDHPNDYRYTLGWNDIQYAPDPTCGNKRVYIENLATLSLYIYTPYTPNDASLANYPGTADCGAYGNRNFFMYFKEWFGSPSYKAPSCDSRVSDVACVWRLYNPATMSEFLTTSSLERDNAVIQSRYSYEDIAFYAFTSQRSGTVPVYRIKMPNQHFYTSSEQEKNSLLQDPSNSFEGVAFYVYPQNGTTNSTYQTYRLYSNLYGHVLVSSAAERDKLISKGYTYESIPFNTPSQFAATQIVPDNKLNVYRLSTSQRHIYTTSLSERDNLVRNNWQYEGLLYTVPSSITNTPVYRLFNGTSHIFTTSVDERDQLARSGWKYETIAWYIDDSTPQTYRFFTNNHHFFTASLDEAFSISNRGARYETVAFGRNQSTTYPIFRLYNGNSHFYTANVNEAISLSNTAWRYEGVGWNTPETSTIPVYRLFGNYHFYTASATERDSLVARGWKAEGIAWYTTPDTNVYRLYNSNHFYTASVSERDSLINSGWKAEGSAW